MTRGRSRLTAPWPGVRPPVAGSSVVLPPAKDRTWSGRGERSTPAHRHLASVVVSGLEIGEALVPMGGRASRGAGQCQHGSTVRTSRTAHRDLTGYDVEAVDGSIGKIDEVSNDAGASYVVVDTGFWIFGKKRLIPAGVIERINDGSRQVYVAMTKNHIKNAPRLRWQRSSRPPPVRHVLQRVLSVRSSDPAASGSSRNQASRGPCRSARLPTPHHVTTKRGLPDGGRPLLRVQRRDRSTGSTSGN